MRLSRSEVLSYVVSVSCPHIKVFSFSHPCSEFVSVSYPHSQVVLVSWPCRKVSCPPSEVVSVSCPPSEIISFIGPHSEVVSSSCPLSEVVSVSYPHLLSEPGGELLLAAGTQPVGPLQVPRVLLQLLALAPAGRQLRHLQLLVEVAGAAEAVTGAGGRPLVPHVTGGWRGDRRGGGVTRGVPAVVLVAVDTRETSPLAVTHLE